MTEVKGIEMNKDKRIGLIGCAGTGFNNSLIFSRMVKGSYDEQGIATK